MLTSIDVKFTFDSARLGLFSSANILQMADVALRVVFLLFLAIISLSSSCSSYSWNEWSVRHLSFHNKNNSTSFPGLNSRLTVHWPVEGCIFDFISSLNTKFFQIGSSITDYGELCVCF